MLQTFQNKQNFKTEKNTSYPLTLTCPACLKGARPHLFMRSNLNSLQVFDKWPVNGSRLANNRLTSRFWCRSEWESPGFVLLHHRTGIVGGPGVLRGSTECWLSQSNLFTANTTNTTSHLNWLKAFSSLNSKLLLAFLEKGFDYI